MDALVKLTLAELMMVRVQVASKRLEQAEEAPSVVTVTSGDEIRLFGDRNLRQTLNRMPGLYTGGTWYLFPQNTVSLRGNLIVQDRHTLLLINGRPAREGKSFPLLLHLPVASLDRVEVVRGPGSVLHGTNAFSGVVNLSLKEAPEEPTIQVRARGGSFGHFDTTVHGGAKVGDFGFYAATRVELIEGWNYSATDQAGMVDSDDFRQRGYSALAHMTFKELKLDVFAAYSEAFHFGPIPEWGASPNQKIVDQRVFADLGYGIDLHEDWHLDLNGTLNYGSDVFYSPAGRQRLLALDFLGEITVLGDPIKGVHVVLGYLKEYQSGEGPADFTLSPQSAYAQFDYLLTEHFKIPSTEIKLILGSQWNQPEDQDSDFIYRVGVILSFKDTFGVKLLRAEAYRAPTGVEQFIDAAPVRVGNPDLNPEVITTYDVQLFARGQRSEATLTYFHSTIENLIVSSPSNLPPPRTFINGGTQKMWGLEFEARHFFTPYFFVSASVAYQENEEDEDIAPSLFPQVVGKAAVGYQGGRWSASVSYEAYSEPETPAQQGASPEVNRKPRALHLITANVEYDLTDWLKMKHGNMALSGRIENLLDWDIDYPESARPPSPKRINSLPGGPGIAFYVGLRAGF